MVTKVTGKMVDDVILIGDRIDAEMLGTAPSEEAAWELVEKTIKFHRETLKDD